MDLDNHITNILRNNDVPHLVLEPKSSDLYLHLGFLQGRFLLALGLVAPPMRPLTSGRTVRSSPAATVRY